MATKRIIATAFFSCLLQLGFGQIEPKEPSLNRPVPPGQAIQHYVLKLNDKSLNIGSGRLDKVKLDSIKVEWISEMKILKGAEAVAQYGTGREGGVVIVTLREASELPEEIQKAFDAVKKD
jgi:hypothetical protein